MQWFYGKSQDIKLPTSPYCFFVKYLFWACSHLFLCSDKQKTRVVKKHTYQINHTVEPQGE